MKPARLLAVGFTAGIVLAACSGGDDDASTPTQAADTVTATATPAPTPTSTELEVDVDLTALPIGDAISAGPQAGAVWACETQFGGGGATGTGGWLSDDGTFDLTAKPLVDGEVYWRSELDIAESDDALTITGNGLPDHATGQFPVGREDDAYNFDRNPNVISAQGLAFTVRSDPGVTAEAFCLPLGPIGVLLTGSVFFNALDAAGRDAVAYEIQDSCGGHPEMGGTYHYHSLTDCIDDDAGGVHSPLLGYALDGFGLYGHHGEGGVTIANADLDDCHGHSHDLDREADVYHYHATWEYPYTLGCFRGLVNGVR